MDLSTKYPRKLKTFLFYEVFFKFLLNYSCFYEAHDPFQRFNRTDVFIDFVSTILFHESFIKQACNLMFITHLKNTKHCRDDKGLSSSINSWVT